MDRYGIWGDGYQNEVEAEKDKNKAFTYYQNPADIELDEETSTLESKGNAPGEEDYQRLVEIEKDIATKLDKKEKKEKELEDAPARPGDNRNNETIEEDQEISNINYKQLTKLNLGNEEKKIGPDELIDQDLANRSPS
ncbi:hypothetical protein F8M41_017619 [Gigaspora margarita]|uniref:Uncharacterized protein n=1 Tax=Gigaspora margarita TaxID=4874 RepID=A0A8H4AMS1_GIGMA|nr:hypothetical protein F8M41_017619 [Gigaspora margarita]